MAIVGWSSAAFLSLWFTEWLIHLPGLNFVGPLTLTTILSGPPPVTYKLTRVQIIGFPLQFLGVVMTPILVARYFLDKKDVGEDVVNQINDLAKRLPGLDGKK